MQQSNIGIFQLNAQRKQFLKCRESVNISVGNQSTIHDKKKVIDDGIKKTCMQIPKNQFITPQHLIRLISQKQKQEIQRVDKQQQQMQQPKRQTQQSQSQKLTDIKDCQHIKTEPSALPEDILEKTLLRIYNNDISKESKKKQNDKRIKRWQNYGNHQRYRSQHSYQQINNVNNQSFSAFSSHTDRFSERNFQTLQYHQNQPQHQQQKCWREQKYKNQSRTMETESAEKYSNRSKQDDHSSSRNKFESLNNSCISSSFCNNSSNKQNIEQSQSSIIISDQKRSICNKKSQEQSSRLSDEKKDVGATASTNNNSQINFTSSSLSSSFDDQLIIKSSKIDNFINPKMIDVKAKSSQQQTQQPQADQYIYVLNLLEDFVENSQIKHKKNTQQAKSLLTQVKQQEVNNNIVKESQQNNQTLGNLQKGTLLQSNDDAGQTNLRQPYQQYPDNQQQQQTLIDQLSTQLINQSKIIDKLSKENISLKEQVNMITKILQVANFTEFKLEDSLITPEFPSTPAEDNPLKNYIKHQEKQTSPIQINKGMSRKKLTLQLLEYQDDNCNNDPNPLFTLQQ